MTAPGAVAVEATLLGPGRTARCFPAQDVLGRREDAVRAMPRAHPSAADAAR